MMITKDDAVKLCHRATLYHMTAKNADGTPVRCRVNGKCKTWKSWNREHEFKLPVKHGIYIYFYITCENASEWTMSVLEAKSV